MNKQKSGLLLRGLPIVLGVMMLSRATCPAAAETDYEEPKILVGKIFAQGPGRKLLFQSQRTATRSGTTVKVVCEYTYPNGSLAARDGIIYEAGRLASFETEELQTVEKGSAVIRPEAKNPGKRKLFFQYTKGRGDSAKNSSDSESMNSENETLVDDMIPAFISTHWDTLMNGQAAKFRYIALSRTETVGFKLVKDSEAMREGKSVIRIKMEPTSLIIAALVDPLFFVVEKAAPHRVLEYIGRTTPMIKNGNGWKDLDAVTVFEWK